MNKMETKTMCNYCGEEKAQTKIPDPNGGKEDWDVCITCSKIIPRQQAYSFFAMMADKEQKRIRDIAREADKEVFCAEIKRK